MSGLDIVVMKHGSSTVENDDGIGIDQYKVDLHVAGHLMLHSVGIATVEVSSGAVVEGREYVTEHGRDPASFSDVQLAKFGTPRQMFHWQNAAARHGLLAEQILATHHDIDEIPTKPFIIAGIRLSASMGIVPVINENNAADDTETRILEQSERAEGDRQFAADNDWLAAHLAIAIGAKALLIFTDREGFEIDGVVQREIKISDLPEMERHCQEQSMSGTGGMFGKLNAAAKAAQNGIDAIIGSSIESPFNLLRGASGTRVVQ